MAFDYVSMEQRLIERLTEIAGLPDPNGQWAVYWPARRDGDPLLDRYPTRRAAKAAARICIMEVSLLLLGPPYNEFFVHNWDGEKWVPDPEH